MFLNADTCARLGFDRSVPNDAAEALERIGGVTESIGDGAAQYGFIHGDLHQWNYLFRDHEVRVIDFEDCGWGHYSYNVAVTLSYFLYQIPGLAASAPYERFRDAFVAGYERIRMLPDGWEQACDVYMAARLLAMGSFMLDDASGMDAIPCG